VLASGRAHRLSGRYIHAEHDDIEDLIAHAGQIVANNFHAIRFHNSDLDVSTAEARFQATRERTGRSRQPLGPAPRCQLGARTPTKSGETGDTRQRSETADVADMQG
jgi:hypothetical protein